MRPILSMLWRWRTTFIVSGQSSSLTRREAKCTRNEVGIKTEISGAGHKLDKVAALKRLTAREVELQDAELPGFGQHPLPLRRTQLLAVVREVERVGAVRAVERAGVGELGQHAERPIHRQAPPIA